MLRKHKNINANGELQFRCSSLGDIMASPSQDKLPEGAKTIVKKIFKEYYLGYEEPFVETEAMQKGTTMEPEAIKILNQRYDEFYEKNEKRLNNGFISGECDIYTPELIRDVKCSWSKITFPILPEDGKNTKYEWQGRGYMWLWDVDNFKLDYVLMTTPKKLRKPWESPMIHECDDLDLKFRVTTLEFTRDTEKEEQIKNRILNCRKYFNELKEKFNINQ